MRHCDRFAPWRGCHALLHVGYIETGSGHTVPLPRTDTTVPCLRVPGWSNDNIRALKCIYWYCPPLRYSTYGAGLDILRPSVESGPVVYGEPKRAIYVRRARPYVLDIFHKFLEKDVSLKITQADQDNALQ